MGRFSKEGRLVTGAAVLAEVVRSALAPSSADATANQQYFEDQLIPPQKNVQVVPLNDDGQPVFERGGEEIGKPENATASGFELAAIAMAGEANLLQNTNEVPALIETERQYQNQLYAIPQVQIDEITWQQLQQRIPEDEREEKLAQESITFSFSFEVEADPDTRPDARTLFPNNPELAAVAQHHIDAVYLQNGPAGVYELLLEVDHQTLNGIPRGAATLLLPENVILGQIEFEAGSQVSLDQNGQPHYLEPGVVYTEEGEPLVDVDRVEVVPVSTVSDHLRHFPFTQLPEDPDTMIMVGLDTEDHIVVVITSSIPLRIYPLTEMTLTTNTNVRTLPSTSSETVTQRKAGDVLTLTTYEKVVAVMGTAVPEGLQHDLAMNTGFVDDGQYIWYPLLQVGANNQESIGWIARLNEAAIAPTGTPVAPDLGIVMASFSEEQPELSQPGAPENSELNALNTNWVEMAQSNPERLREYQLAPELELALQNPDYLQLGYLNEAGEFVGIPIVFNPLGDEEWQERLANNPHFPIRNYYLVMTEKTPEVITQIISPHIQTLYADSDIENLQSQPPQILITFNGVATGMDFIATTNLGDVFRRYDPETNVLSIILKPDFNIGPWGGDILRFVERGISIAFTGEDRHPSNDNYDWAEVVNPMIGEPEAGMCILDTDGEMEWSTAENVVYEYGENEYSRIN